MGNIYCESIRGLEKCLFFAVSLFIISVLEILCFWEVVGMPVYEYECGACGGRFEATLKFSDPALTECSICNASNIRKLLSNTSFVLKG